MIKWFEEGREQTQETGKNRSLEIGCAGDVKKMVRESLSGEVMIGQKQLICLSQTRKRCKNSGTAGNLATGSGSSSIVWGTRTKGGNRHGICGQEGTRSEAMGC